MNVRLIQQQGRVRLAREMLSRLRKDAAQRPWGKWILDLISAVLDCIRKDMDEAIPDLETDDKATNTIEDCARHADSLQMLMESTERATGRLAPQVFRESFAKLAEILLPGAKPPEILISSLAGPRNYSMDTKILEGLKPVYEKGYTEVQFPDHSAILHCPGPEFEDALQHAAVFHEFGHAFRAWVKGLQASGKALENKLPRYSVPEGTGLVQELEADAFAVRVAGPAPGFAVAFKAGDTESVTHPPRADRIALANLYLEPFTDDEYIHWAHTALQDELESGPHTFTDEELKEVCRSVDENISSVHNYASSEPYGRIKSLADRICSYVPPDILYNKLPVTVITEKTDNGKSQSHLRWNNDTIDDLPSMKDILNAGWYVRLNKKYWEPFVQGLGGSLDNAEDEFKAEAKLNRLLTKAMETVHLMKKFFQDRRGQ